MRGLERPRIHTLRWYSSACVLAVWYASLNAVNDCAGRFTPPDISQPMIVQPVGELLCSQIGATALQGQAFLGIQAIDSLVIDCPAFMSEEHVELAIPGAGPGRRRFRGADGAARSAAGALGDSVVRDRATPTARHTRRSDTWYAARAH